MFSLRLLNQNKKKLIKKQQTQLNIITYKSNQKKNNIQTKIIIFVPYCEVYKPFIISCLTSIENQNYKYFHVILINDGAKNICFLEQFIKEKDFYTLVNLEENNGPAYSKWKFIEYIQQNSENFNKNDIVTIMDGDDKYNTEDALSIINETFAETGCWVSFGEITGKYYNIHKERLKNINLNNIRKQDFCFNHPRSMKLGLLLKLTKEDFILNNEWIKKCTDMTMLYSIFELTPKNKIVNCENKIYWYREHTNNSINMVSTSYKSSVIKYIKHIQPKKEIRENIHVVMCCWKRIQNLEYQVRMLNNQSVAKKIHFHLVNNNQDNIKILDEKVYEFKKKYKNITLYLSHYDNKYSCFQRFIYIKDNILKKTLINYVIIIDDDQYYDKYWVEKMYNIRSPRSIKGQWTKIFSNNNYWSEINRTRKYVDYVGPGGSIIDTSIFNEMSKIWDIPNDLPENISPYFIDDIWLSFIAYKYYSWELQYSFLPEYKTFNVKNSDSKKQALCDTLYKEKQKFFDYLIKKGWNLKKNNTNKIYKNYKNNNINNNFNNILFKIKR